MTATGGGRLYANWQTTRGPAPLSGIVPCQGGKSRGKRRGRPMRWRRVYAPRRAHSA